MGWKHTVVSAAFSVCMLGPSTGCAPDLDPDFDDDDSSEDLVSPSNAQALSSVLVIPGATRVSGLLPTAATGTGGSGPTISGGSSLTVTSGNQATLSFDYTSSSGYRDCYVQVRGASDYFRLSVPNLATSGRISIPVKIPSTVSAGSFSFSSLISNASGAFSNSLSTSVGVSRTASTPSTPSTPTPSTPKPSTSGATCSAVSSVGSCSLQFCLRQDASACWYTAAGRTFNCSACTGAGLQTCATQAANQLTTSCR